MKTYKVWCPSDTDEDGADEIEANDDESAAEQWMRAIFDGEELCTTVCVRSPDGTLTRVMVAAEVEWVYTARRE